MNATNSSSVRGDTEARRRGILDAAAAILDVGGYAALTIRTVAKQAGMSPGLIYQYFVDKRDIFAALLLESQQELTAFIAEQPRDQGVSALIAAMVPETTKQWARVGHVASVWRTTEDASNSDGQVVQDLRRSTETQFAELRNALQDAAGAQGLSLREGPSLIPFVWAGLMGLADTIVNNWAQDLDMSDYIAYSADGLARAITH